MKDREFGYNAAKEFNELPGSEFHMSEDASKARKIFTRKAAARVAAAMLTAVVVADSFGMDILGGEEKVQPVPAEPAPVTEIVSEQPAPAEPAEVAEPAEPEGPVPTGNTTTLYWLNGNAAILTEYSDGNLYSEEGVIYWSNGHGTYSGDDGSTLYTQMPDPVSGTQHGLTSQGSGRPVLVILDGDTYRDPDGTTYTEQEDGTFVADNGDVFNVAW